MSDRHFKTLEDGSIDYRHYTQRGRGMRSDAAHAMITGIGNAIGLLAARMIGRSAPGRSQVAAGPAAKAVASVTQERHVWHVG